jgi:phosphopantothenoylcysteine synthetase/decarboxylase
VWTDTFAVPDGVLVPHAHLGRRAEVILVLPASAATIARLAQAACDGLLSLTVAASSCPVVVPAILAQRE